MPIFKGRRTMKKKPAGPGKMNNKSRKKKRIPKRPKKKILNPQQPNIENTGMESLYLKELIEDEKLVVVVLTNGEKVRGHIRYYDRDVFSIGPVEGGPKMFVRKDGVRYLYEE